MDHAIRILLLAGVLTPCGRICGQPADGPPRPVRWAVALGARVEQAGRVAPTVDRVVLVPDAATYLDELARWSPQGRWPVLIEDDRLAPMFLRRFRPAQVIRRDAVGPGPDAVAITRQRLEAVVVGAWGGDPKAEDASQVFARQGHVPPGVVIASADDPAWTAAVALAAGHGEPLGWLDEDFGRPNQALGSDAMARLQAAVDRLAAATGYPHAALGDAIDAITLCRAVAGRVNLAPPGAEPEIRAVTDVLGRHGFGPRYACTGWIFGDETRSAYTAMCSLFLERTRFLLVNTYPAEGGWAAYDVGGAAARLAAWGVAVETRRGAQAGMQAWLEMLPGGIDDDVVVMNSKGNASFFDLADGRASAGDVPVLNVPATVYLIHSWSMRSPENPATIAGRWLQRGAYAFVGSTDEPTLGAFVPPAQLAERWAAGVPFLVAARRWDDSPAWKVNTYGDPLMRCRPPGDALPRITWPVESGRDLRVQVKDLMRRADAAGTGDAFAEAIATLALLGEDEVAVRMWQLAAERGQGAAGAPAALGPLFRLRRTDDYVAAWREIREPDALATDMLWQLLSPRLPLAAGPELLVLEGAIRADQPDADLERLAPRLAAVLGAAHARRTVQVEIGRARRAATRRKLQQLLKALN